MKFVFLPALVFISSLLSGQEFQPILTSPTEDLNLEQSLGEQQALPVEFENPDPTNPLPWQILFQGEPADPLERIVHELENSPEPLLSLLPGRLDFEDGESGVQISLSGFSEWENRIYCGNERITYFNLGVATIPVGGGTVRYTTAKLPGLFVFSGELEDVRRFNIRARRDNQPGVVVSTNEFTIEVAGMTWRAFIKRVQDPSTPGSRGRKPSVNQMVLLPDSPGVTSTVDPNNDSNGPTITNLPASTSLHYFFFSRPEGATYDQSVFEEFASTFLHQILPGPGWCQANPASGIIPAGDSTSLDLQISTRPANIGSTTTRFAIVTPGTDPDTLPPSAWQSLTLETSPPEFQFPEEPLLLTSLAGEGTTSVEFEVLPAPGETAVPPLTVTSSADWLAATALPNQRWEVLAQLSGLAPGAYSESLTLSDGQSTITLPVQIEVASRNFIELLPDPTRPRLYALSKVGSQTGFLVIHDTVTRSETGALALGHGPTDFVLNEDASEMFVLNSRDPSISRIDLESLTIVETIPLDQFEQFPGNYDPRIAVGPGSILYYTDEASLPTLRVFDFNTRSVLQTLAVEIEEDPRPYVIYSFGELALDRSRSGLFGWIGSNGGGSGASSYVTRFTVAEDGTLSGFSRERIQWASFSNRGFRNLPILFGEDGDFFLFRRSLFDRDEIGSEVIGLPSEAFALSPGGELAGLFNGIYNRRNESLTNVPGSPPKAFTPDYAWFTSIADDNTITWTDLSEIVTPANLDLKFEPANEDGVVLPSVLKWPPTREGRRYQIYLGTDPSAVAAATSESPEFLGSFSANTLPLPDGLEAGERYYWKVVPDRGGNPDFEQVRSFTSLQIDLTRKSIETTSVAGVARRVEQFPIQASPETTWQLSSSEPWIVFDEDSGTGSASPNIIINSEVLDAGNYRGEVTLTVNGIAVRIPLTLAVSAMQNRQVENVPGEDVIWASSWTDNKSAFLIEYDTVTGRYESIIPTNLLTSQFIIHPQDDRVYAVQRFPGIILGFDRSSREQVFSYELPRDPDSYRPSLEIREIFSGPKDRLVIQIVENGLSSLRLIDTGTGNALDEITNLQPGGGVTSRDGTTFYYGTSSSANATVIKFDLTNDDLSESDRSQFVGSGRAVGSSFLKSSDETRFAWNGGILDTDLNLLGVIPDRLFAISGDGSFVSTTRDLYNVSNGLLVGRLPAGTTRQTFGGSGEILYQFDREVLATNLSEFALLPDRDVIPAVADGATVRLSEAQLSWEPEPTAVSYTVYFGNSRDQVAAADSSSPEFLGTVISPEWEGPLPGIELGGTYFWRIDLQGPGQSRIGSVQEFSVAPIATLPTHLILPTLVGRPIEQQRISFQSQGIEGWSAATSDPWILLDQPAGAITEDLTFTVNSENLSVRTHVGSIAITSGGETIEVLIEVDLVKPNFERFVVDPNRSRVYGFNSKGRFDLESRNHLMAINTETAEIEDVIRIGRNVTDLVIDSVTDHLIVSNNGYPETRVVDLTRFEEIEPLMLGDEVFTLEIDPERRLLITEDQQNPVTIRLFNLDTMELLTRFSSGAGVATIDLTRDIYYRNRGGTLEKFDLEADPPARLAEAGIDFFFEELLGSADGRSIVSGNRVYNPNLEFVNILPSDALALSPNANLAVSASALHWLDDNASSKELPFTADVATFTSNGNRLLLFDRDEERLESIPLDSLIKEPNQVPRDGRWLEESPNELVWEPVEGASSYTVNLSSPLQGSLVFDGLTDPRLALPVEFSRSQFVTWSVTADFADRDPVTSPDYRFGVRIRQHSTLEGVIPYTPEFGPGHLLSKSSRNGYILRTFDHNTGAISVIEQNEVIPSGGIPSGSQFTTLDRFRAYQALPEKMQRTTPPDWFSRSMRVPTTVPQPISCPVLLEKPGVLETGSPPPVVYCFPREHLPRIIKPGSLRI